jgi:collagen triple helix repeat protein
MMMRGSRMLRRALILGGLCVLVAAVASVGWAMSSATSDKLVACAKKKGGALRLVVAAKDCRKTERAVTWNQQGQRGLPGLKGEDGLNGEDGIDGEDGVDGDDGDDGVDGIDGDDAAVKWHYFFGTAVNVNSGASLVPAGTCAGTPTPQAVNGGVRVTGLPANVRVIASAPVGAATTATQWELQIENTSGSTQSVTPWVLCSAGTAG